MRFFLVSVMLLASGAACAAEDQRQTLRVTAPHEFAQSRELIEIALGESAQFRKMRDWERRRVIKALDRMQSALSGITSIDALDRPTRTQLFNDQEWINNLLTRLRDDSRLICKREKLTGSHRVSDVCVTVADRKRHRDAALEANDRLHRGQRGGNSLF